MIRPLTSADAQAFAALRFAATQANPECFCTSLVEVSSYPVDFYRQEIEKANQLADQALLGYFHQNQLIGVLGVERLIGELRQHRGRLWGLMVSPDYRRKGVAEALCQTALFAAKQMNVESLNLELTGEAAGAMSLYRKLGFEVDSITSRAIKLEGRYLDEIRMSLAI